jgi:hypothetical protein
MLIGVGHPVIRTYLQYHFETHDFSSQEYKTNNQNGILTPYISPDLLLEPVFHESGGPFND